MVQCVEGVHVRSYELITAPEKVWGGPDKDGNWNGMLGVLQRGVSHGEDDASQDLKEIIFTLT